MSHFQLQVDIKSLLSHPVVLLWSFCPLVQNVSGLKVKLSLLNIAFRVVNILNQKYFAPANFACQNVYYDSVLTPKDNLPYLLTVCLALKCWHLTHGVSNYDLLNIFMQQGRYFGASEDSEFIYVLFIYLALTACNLLKHKGSAAGCHRGGHS